MSKLVKIPSHTFLGISLPGFYGNEIFPSPIIGVLTTVNYKAQLQCVEDTYACHISNEFKSDVSVSNVLNISLSNHNIIQRAKAVFSNKLTYKSNFIFMNELCNSIQKPVIVILGGREMNIKEFITNQSDNLDCESLQTFREIAADNYSYHKELDKYFTYFLPEKYSKLSEEDVKGLITLATIDGKLPECLKIARMIVRSIQFP